MADPFIAHCLELLKPLGGIRGKRMFSGCGIYADEVFVAIVLQEELFLKVDEETRPAFEAAGGHPFVYRRGEKEGRLGFWTVPPEAMESPPLMLPWARLALAAALRARAARPMTRPKAAREVPKKVAKKVAGKVAKRVARKTAEKTGRKPVTTAAHRAAKKAAAKA